MSVTLHVKDLWIRRGSAITLVNVSFIARPKELTGIIGPNGAGKSTLVSAICGERPYRGDVILKVGEYGKEESLYAEGATEYWLPRIGYVPVDDVLHTDLTIRSALFYVGQLRLPNEPARELRKQIEHLLDDFAVPVDARNRVLRKLSSGQRKKVSICAELLTDPPVLLLDEPTSNLDPNAEYELMRLLRKRAEERGQTIIIITHTLNTLNFCHRTVFLENSQVARGGTGWPHTVQSNLWGDLKNTGIVSDEPDSFKRWVRIFDHFVSDSARQQDLRAEKEKEWQSRPLAPPTPPSSRIAARQSWGSQLWVLLRRYIRRQVASFGTTLLKLFIGLAGGFLLLVLRTDSFVPSDRSNIDVTDVRNGVFYVSFIVMVLGLLSSFQEITSEWRIYQHERLKGLSIWAYIFSKWLPLMMLGVLVPIEVVSVLVFFHHQPLYQTLTDQPGLMVQGVVASANPVWLQAFAAHLPSKVVEVSALINIEGLITLILACFAAISLGLMISALAWKSNNLGNAILGVFLIFQVLMSGLSINEAWRPVTNVLEIFAVNHWAIRGYSIDLSIYCWNWINNVKDYYSLGMLTSVWLALVTYTGICLSLCYFFLRIRDPWVPAWRTGNRMLTAHATSYSFLILCIAIGSIIMLRQSSREYDHLYTTLSVNGYPPAVDLERLRSASGPERWLASLSVSQCYRNYPETATDGESASLVQPVLVPTEAPTEVPTEVLTVPSSGGLQDPSTPTPRETASEVPTYTPTVDAVAALNETPTALVVPDYPEGVSTEAVELQYGPDLAVIEPIPQGAPLLMLDRDPHRPWVRVLWLNSGGTQIIGWIPVSKTSFIISQANDSVVVPPRCARPQVYMHNAQLSWKSQRASDAVVLVDLFRDSPGDRLTNANVRVLVNDQETDSQQVDSRGRFLIFQRKSLISLKASDIVSIRIDGGGPELRLFAVVFLVETGCSL